jgi:putative endonuclease
MTNKSHSTVYTGVTNNLVRRVWEHQNKTADGFTKKYNCTKLVFFEHGNCIEGAIKREKEIKGWLRKKKNNLIEMNNPLWEDLGLKLDIID